MILVAHARDYGDKAVVQMLKLNGFDAALVSSGAMALEFLHRHKPRLLLLNGTLEDVDGLELLRAVRADPTLADLPVCLISSDWRREREATPLGIDAFLSPVRAYKASRQVGQYRIARTAQAPARRHPPTY